MNPRLARRWGLAVATVVLAVASSFGQSSSSYRMDRVTVTSSAGTSSSLDFTLSVTFAQQGPVGSISRCNDSFVQSMGYWSILGETPVPIVLRIGRDMTDPSLPHLTWSGSSSSFTVYRSTAAPGVVDPLNTLLITNACSAVDTPPPATVVYYVVLPDGGD